MVLQGISAITKSKKEQRKYIWENDYHQIHTAELRNIIIIAKLCSFMHGKYIYSSQIDVIDQYTLLTTDTSMQIDDKIKHAKWSLVNYSVDYSVICATAN